MSAAADVILLQNPLSTREGGEGRGEGGDTP